MSVLLKSNLLLCVTREQMTERYLVIDETDAHYKDFKTRVTILL